MTFLSLNSNLCADDATWTGAAEDKVFSNVDNWSTDPAGNNLYISPTGDEADGMTLNTSMTVGNMYMGNDAASADSSLTLNSGANLSGAAITIGLNAKGTLTVESGATLTTTEGLLPGGGSGSTGVINITGGSVTVGAATQIGNYGKGEVNVSGGEVIYNGQTRIANWGTEDCALNISGGSVSFKERLYIGQRGHQKGSVTLSGTGEMSVDGFLFVGGGGSKNNTSGGNLSGSDGSGILTLKGNSTLTVNGNPSDGGFYLGACDNTSTVYRSILNVSENAVMTATGMNFYVASGFGTATSKAQAEINLSGGTINANATRTLVADSSGSSADINVSGGALNISGDLWMGTRGTATITLSGGEINASKGVFLGEGHSSASKGIVNQTGGTFNATSASGILFGSTTSSATTNVSTGTYNLSGGTLNAAAMQYGDKKAKTANFNVSGTGVANISGAVAVPTTVSGGTLNANSIAIPANGTLAVSGGTVKLGDGGITAAGTYTLTLSGGTLSTKDASWTSALNAAVSNTVTFSPQANQTITLTGVLSGSGNITKTGAGTLTLSGNNTYSGNTTINAGTLSITGGTITTNKLLPGVNSGETGVVNISGGTVTVAAESEIGNNGSGKITVSDSGKLTFNGTARIANMGKAECYINLEDNAEMTVANLFVGQRGALKGSMTLTDSAKLRVTNNINIGTDSGSNGSGNMTLKDNASVLVSPLTGTNSSRAYLGYHSGTSTLDVSGKATFKVENIKDFLIGEAGTGVVNQTGGTITLNPTGTIFLADAKNGKANLNISGGKFNIGNTLIAGTRGTATINLSSNGEINADGKIVLAPGYETTSNTTVNQTGGTFNANAGIVYGNYFANRGTGVYKLSGGTLNTTFITYGNNTPSSASFELSGNGVANIKGTWDTETETQTALGVLSVPTTVSGGTLNVDTISIPAGKALAISGGTVNLGEGGITAPGAYTVTLSGGTLTTKGSADWSSALNATVSNTVTFKPGEDQTIAWSGALTGSGAVKLNDEGTLTLSGANTYSGGTTVSVGVLELTGDAVSAYGPMTVGDDGTLEYNLPDGQTKKLSLDTAKKILSTGKVIKSGKGTLQLYEAASGAIDVSSLVVSSGRMDIKGYMSGSITVDANGVFSPGNSVGDAKFGGGYELKDGAMLLIEQDADGIDTLTASSFEIDPNAMLKLTVGSVVPGATYPIIIQQDGDNPVNFGVVTIGDVDYDYSDASFWNSLLTEESAYYWNLSVNGNKVMATLDANAVPEPSTWALLVLGAAGMLYWRKRKNLKA